MTGMEHAHGGRENRATLVEAAREVNRASKELFFALAAPLEPIVRRLDQWLTRRGGDL